ncbi:carboxyl-terminal processing protease [Chryseobacterium sp. H1D6B]|uniref:S41 family peptidase n=1 Tax=Chryseobacterium sp. H1D6B TaxID=2940588 RepID=UPI0015CCBE77|nr:S41 family peptidase [Chryseobacterium sp. H1D6B]MDH6253461.1 carboxyl-terminal processing protease [Chryseobacterium sp. H1D6B]
MNTTKNIFFSLGLALSGGTAAGQEIPKSLTNTVWKQQGYDRVLEIKDSTYSYYNINSVACKALAEGIFNGRFRVVSSKKGQLVLNPGGIVNYNFTPVDPLSSKCTGEPKKEMSYQKNFQVFWETFNDNYAFFKERNVDWKAIYSQYFPLVQDAKTDQQFAGILKEIIGKLKDGHIRLDLPDALKDKPAPAAAVSGTVRTRQALLSDLKTKYAKDLKSYNGGVLEWGFLKDSKTGYILITDMNNFADYFPGDQQNTKEFSALYDKVSESKTPQQMFDDELAGTEKIMKTVLEDLNGASSVVIDLRFNGGGYETVALKLLSYFVKSKKKVLSITAKTSTGFTPKQDYTLYPAQKEFDKPVYLLLGPSTASAAEIFALGALDYPNITRIGSRTSGIFSEILWKELPNGWEFSLSNEIYTDKKGKTYEGTGIPVTIEMDYPRKHPDFNKSFYPDEIFRDKALDKVLELEKLRK